MTAQKFTDFSISSILGDKKNTSKRTKEIANYKYGDQDLSNRAAKIVKYNTSFYDNNNQASNKLQLMDKLSEDPKLNNDSQLFKKHSVGVVYSDKVYEILKLLPKNTDYELLDDGQRLVVNVSLSLFDVKNENLFDFIYGHLYKKVINWGKL